jgi:hypothetical protein
LALHTLRKRHRAFHHLATPGLWLSPLFYSGDLYGTFSPEESRALLQATEFVCIDLPTVDAFPRVWDGRRTLARGIRHFLNTKI